MKEKNRYSVWRIAVVVAVLICAVASIYLIYMQHTRGTEYLAVQTATSGADGVALAEGVVVQQELELPVDLSVIEIHFTRLSKQPEGRVHLAVKDRETGNLVYEAEVAATELGESEFYGFRPENPVPAQNGRKFLLELTGTGSNGESGIAVDFVPLEELIEETLRMGRSYINGIEKGIPISFRVSFTMQREASDSFLIISLTTILIFILIYVLAVKKTWEIERLFLVSCILLGVMYSFVLTPGTVPDEVVHFEKTLALSNVLMGKADSVTQENVEIEEEDLGIYYYSHNLTLLEYSKFEKSRFFAMEQKREPVLWTGKEVGNIFTHFVAAVGMSLARFLNLGFNLRIYFARWANLLLFALLTWFGIRKLPTGKEVMALIALLPITMQEAGSVSYDAVINGLAFCLMGYLLAYLYGTGARITKRDMAVILVTGALLSTMKYGAYMPLFVLILGMKTESFESWKHKFGFFFLSGFVAVVLVVLVNLSSFAGVLSESSGIAAESIDTVSSTYAFSDLLHAPKLFVIMLMTSFTEMKDFYFSSMLGQNLSWFTVTVPTIVLLGFLFPLLAGLQLKEENIRLEGKQKLLILFAAGCVVLFFFAAAFTWTDVGENFIQGVQGRYFLPFLPAVILAGENTLVRVDGRIRNYLIPCVAGMHLIVFLEIFRQLASMQ